jgi:hypothetical protein
MRRLRFGGRAVTLLLALGVLALAAGAAHAANGTLKVTSFPSGAEVLIGGISTGKVTPMSVSLAEGEHDVTVQIPGDAWTPDTRKVTIVAGNNDLSVTLIPALTEGPPALSYWDLNGDGVKDPAEDVNNDGFHNTQDCQGPEGLQGETGPQGPAGPAGSCVDCYTRAEVDALLEGLRSLMPFRGTEIDAGGRHTCGVRTDGTVECWGDDREGQSTPPAGTFTQVSAGDNHTCGVNGIPYGDVVCWGSDEYGQSTPPVGTFWEVSAGEFHTCGLRPDQTVECWGLDTDGQSTPPAGTFRQVAVGQGFSCGLRSDGFYDYGLVECWGGYIGPVPPLTFVQISGGSSHACGLRRDGSVECWGSDLDGQSSPLAP